MEKGEDDKEPPVVAYLYHRYGKIYRYEGPTLAPNESITCMLAPRAPRLTLKRILSKWRRKRQREEAEKERIEEQS